MPTYQYACTACDHSFEQFQSFTDDALTECPQCAGRLRKVYNAVGVVFKGSGFYRTDSRTTPAGKEDGGAKTGDGAASKEGTAASSENGKGGSQGKAARTSEPQGGADASKTSQPSKAKTPSPTSAA